MENRLNEVLTDTLYEWEVDCQPETIAQMTEHLMENGVTIPVRCGECKYKNEWTKNGIGEYFCRRSGLWNLTDNCFCHCGETSKERENG